MRTLLATGLTVAALFFATSSTAQIYQCVRSSVSNNGFTSIAAAKKFYPADFKFRIQKGKMEAEGFGITDVKKSGSKMNAVYKFPKNPGFSMRITFFPKSNRYSMYLNTAGAYESTGGARGKCAPLK